MGDYVFCADIEFGYNTKHDTLGGVVLACRAFDDMRVGYSTVTTVPMGSPAMTLRRLPTTSMLNT